MLLLRILRPMTIVMTLTAIFCLLQTEQAGAKVTVDCFSCHDREAFQKKVKHEPVASGECLSCHSPHVARYKGMLQKKVKDLCYSCHTERAEQQSQGFVHKPVEQGECLGCHNPHASDQAALLKDRPGEICFTCHTEIAQKIQEYPPSLCQGAMCLLPSAASIFLCQSSGQGSPRRFVWGATRGVGAAEAPQFPCRTGQLRFLS